MSSFKLFTTIPAFVFILLLIKPSGALFSQDSYDADSLYNIQEYSKAFSLYDNCFKADSIIHCGERASICAFHIGDYASSKYVAIALEKIDSSNHTAISQLAKLYELEKNTPKSIKYYHKLVKIYPTNAIFIRKLGQQYLQAGLITDAFRYLSQALKVNPRDMIALKSCADIFISNKQFSEGDSLLRQGLSYDTLNISLHLSVAQSKFRQKAYDSTAFYLEKIIGIIDLSPYYNKLLGYSYIQLDSLNNAIYHLEKSLQDEGNKEYAHYYLATAYEKLDSSIYAKHHYEQAIDASISKNVGLYHKSLGQILDDEGNQKDAIPHYKDAIKFGDDPLNYFLLAKASDTYYRDKTIALRYYKKYLESNPKRKEYHSYARERVQLIKGYLHQAKGSN